MPEPKIINTSPYQPFCRSLDEDDESNDDDEVDDKLDDSSPDNETK